MVTFVNVEGDLRWVNAELIESISVQVWDDPSGENDYPMSVVIHTVSDSHVYTRLCLDEDHGKLIAARLVGVLMGTEEQRPEGSWPDDGYAQTIGLQ